MRIPVTLPSFALALLVASTAFAQEPSAYTDPEALRALLFASSPSFILVDVRTREEYTAGHIPRAINIPYDTIGEKPPAPDTSALIIVYCASGIRSAKAAATLRAKGYTSIADFGSVRRWKWQLVEGSDPGEPPDP